MVIPEMEQYEKLCFFNGSLYIVCQIDPDMVNLVEYLKISPRDKLSFHCKLEIVRKIVGIMESVNGKTGGSQSHGHLTPNNILISKDGSRVQICDFGYTFLKKYCGFLSGYCNKNQFSSPEVLEQRGLVVLDSTEKDDIYSLALIMWFLFEEQIPFEHMKLDIIKKYILVEKVRPKISENMNNTLAIMLRVCWQYNPENRPSFKEMKDCLDNMKKIEFS